MRHIVLFPKVATGKRERRLHPITQVESEADFRGHACLQVRHDGGLVDQHSIGRLLADLSRSLCFLH